MEEFSILSEWKVVNEPLQMGNEKFTSAHNLKNFGFIRKMGIIEHQTKGLTLYFSVVMILSII